MWCQELDWVVLMDPFQLGVFCDAMILSKHLRHPPGKELLQVPKYRRTCSRGTNSLQSHCQQVLRHVGSSVIKR